MTSEDVDRFKRRLLRTKTIVSQTSVDEDPQDSEGGLKKVLTTFDLVSLGVGSCCGTGMYVVAGLVAKNVAGPAAVLSFVIAALASILSGVCYGEFGVRVPKTSGSAYMYSYVTVGEFVAFLIGWNLILEYMIGSAAGASALSACFDALTNHTMSSHLKENVGTVIGKTYPDFLGCFICMIMTGILAAGVKKSVRFNNILNGINFVVWLFIVIAGLFFVSGENWKDYGGFAPYGMSGVFSGAATCFYAYIGFDIIATTGEEARNPSRSIPVAIIVSLIICLISYMSVSVILTLMIPYVDIHGDSALIDMFVQVEFGAAKYIVAIGSICALTVSLLGSMFPMPRVIYAMSRDGLLFGFLSEINPKFGTPMIATLITGLMASLMSLLVGLQILVEMMSIGTLLAYTLVSVSVLILRYQPCLHELPIPMAHQTLEPIGEESPDGDNDDVFSENTRAGKRKMKDDQQLLSPTGAQPSYGSLPFKSETLEDWISYVRRHSKIAWLRLGFPGDESLPNAATAQNVIIFVGSLCFFEICACMIIVFGHEHLVAGKVWAILLLLVFLFAMLTCLIFILRQPQNKKKVKFMAPGVPLLPCAATFFNIYLMLKLPGLTWARLGIWIVVGLALYFSYSMWHSVKEKKQRQKELDAEKEKDSANQMTGQTVIEETKIDSDVTGHVIGNGNSDGKAPPGGPPPRPAPPRNGSINGRIPSQSSQDGASVPRNMDGENDPWAAAPVRQTPPGEDNTHHSAAPSGERLADYSNSHQMPIGTRDNSRNRFGSDYQNLPDSGNVARERNTMDNPNRRTAENNPFYRPRPRPRGHTPDSEPANNSFPAANGWHQ